MEPEFPSEDFLFFALWVVVVVDSFQFPGPNSKFHSTGRVGHLKHESYELAAL